MNPEIKSILLVEDDPRDVELTLAALAEHHLVDKVAVVTNGVEALDYLNHGGKYKKRPGGNPILVLLDLKMPKVGGLQVLKAVKTDEHLKIIPVVVLSSSRENPDLAECYRQGANAYVVKPVDFGEFMKAVQLLGMFWATINEPPPDVARAEIEISTGRVIPTGKKEVKIKSPLRLLHLEDDPNDAALVRATLEAGGIACEITRVQNRDEFIAALERGGIDLVLSDFSLPAFDGLSAVGIVRARWPDLPVILVSGTLGEEQAIDSLKSGATDYVLKERLSRLVPAVRRALLEAGERAGNRRTEAALQETEQRLRIIFSESPLGIALVGADGRPVLTNTALEKMLGYTAAELGRMTFVEFTHPDDCAKDQELYDQLIRGTRKSYQMEKRYLRKDGQVVWGRLSVSVAREVPGHAGFAIGMIEDITERRHLEAQFIEVQKTEVIGRLASGVAHDFNNILGVIMGYSDMLMAKLAPDSLLLKYADEIRLASQRAAGLTRQLLVFSRKQTVQFVVLDFNDVVEELDKMLRRLIGENIEMTMIPGKQTGRIKADAGYVGQVLMNLVVNARDAMPNGGKLTITTGNVTLDENDTGIHTRIIPGDYVMLSVSDTGTGMTDEVKAHLFEAFFTTKAKGKGTGLGLATCQTIVQQSGGYIRVYSELGGGTTFKIYFPRVDQPLENDTQFIKAGPVPRGTETLLVVEDDPSVRQLACGVLAAQGYAVLSASNGQDALHVAREHKGPPIRLVITDVIMPLMGGKVMAEWLKTTNPDLKILFTSGYTDDVIAHHEMLEAGGAFLSKPYTPATLARKVRASLDGEIEKKK